MQRTALYPQHVQQGAKTTDFHGWEMPLYYTSILDEHHGVRTVAGMFDISHMGQLWVSGADALPTLNAVVVSDLAEIGLQRACYTMMTNEGGGIIDDIIVYRVQDHAYLVIVNCANRRTDEEWLAAHRCGRVGIEPISDGRSIIAVQGPLAGALLDGVLHTPVSSLGRFGIAPVARLGDRAWVARTGYTGSDGFELFLDDTAAIRVWQQLLEIGRANGLQPAGLGARDTLRLEAGLRLHGTDMDQTTTPYEAGLGWTVAIHKERFIGKAVLARQKTEGVTRKLVGFALEEGPVPRHGCSIRLTDRDIGQVTSGTFSPMLGKPIGVGYVEAACATVGQAIQVVIRSQAYPATIVKLPFWKGDADAGDSGTQPKRMVTTC